MGYWRLPALCTLLASGSQLPTRLDRRRAASAIAPRHHPQLQARRHRPEAYCARWRRRASTPRNNSKRSIRAGLVGAKASRGDTGDTGSRDVSPFVTVRPLRPIFEPCRAVPGPSSPTAARARFCAHDLGRKVTENEKIKLGEANSGPSQPVFTPDGTMARPSALPDRRRELRFRRLDRALG